MVDKACGVDYPEYPLVYFATPDSRYLYRTVCVRECPMESPAAALPSALDCQPNSEVTSCEEKASPEKPDESVLIYNTTIC